jgi:protein-tyrosine kinase
MLRPKASHLVERVAEKLLRSGALEESAAQLLDPDRPPTERPAIQPSAPTVLEAEIQIVVAPVAGSLRAPIQAPLRQPWRSNPCL